MSGGWLVAAGFIGALATVLTPLVLIVQIELTSRRERRSPGDDLP